jgi:hypothetical protein
MEAMEGNSDLLVLLRDIEFIDAAGVGVIIQVRNLLRQQSRSWAARAKVFNLCDLTDLIDHPASRSARGRTKVTERSHGECRISQPTTGDGGLWRLNGGRPSLPG